MSQPLFQLTLSADEKTALLNLIHFAVQAKGLDVALNAVVLAQKIQAAPALALVKELPGPPTE